MPRAAPHTLVLRAELAARPERAVRRLRETLAKHRTVEEAARALRVPARTLYRMLRERGVELPGDAAR